MAEGLSGTMSALGQMISGSARSAATSAGAAVSATARKAGQKTPEQKKQEDEKKAIQKLFENAAKNKDIRAIEALTPEAKRVGINPTPYAAVAGALSPEEQTQRSISELMAQALQGQFGGQQQTVGQLAQTSPTPSQPTGESKVPASSSPLLDSLSEGNIMDKLSAEDLSNATTSSTKLEKPINLLDTLSTQELAGMFTPEGIQPLGIGSPSLQLETPAAPATAVNPQSTGVDLGDAPQIPKNKILTTDLLLRAAVKKFTGVQVEANHFDTPAWFESYAQRINSGMGDSQSMLETSREFGFIPDGASNLQMPEIERKVIFEKELTNALNNPEFDAMMREITPKGANLAQAKLGAALEVFTQQGRYIPPHYQQYLDRHRGLEEPEFLSDELKSHAWQIFGKMPSELSAVESRAAQRSLDDRKILFSAQKVANDTLAQLETKYGAEASRAFNATEIAKYGIDVNKFPNAQALAAAGKRFATESEVKVYEQMLGARRKLFAQMEKMFGIQFDPVTLNPLRDKKGNFIGNAEEGIFTGIKSGWWGKTKGKLSLTAERARGTKRGENATIYEQTMADIARTLLVISNDTRFSDADVFQMMRTQGQLGVGLLDLPNSAPEAFQLIKQFMVHNESFLRNLISKTTTGNVEELENLGKPIIRDQFQKAAMQEKNITSSQPPAQQQPKTPQYEIGKVWNFDDGSQRKYVGEGKGDNGTPWQILDQQPK